MTYSMDLLKRSDWPSVCGWNAVDMFNLHCRHLNSAYQNKEVNLTSLSDIILEGIPYLHMMWSKNSYAVAAAVMAIDTGNNKTTFVKRSTMVNIASCPADVGGRLVTKSMATCSNGREGTACGYNKPYGACVLVLCSWHVGHSLQKVSTSVRILGQ